jgi:hypothetical protein
VEFFKTSYLYFSCDIGWMFEEKIQISFAGALHTITLLERGCSQNKHPLEVEECLFQKSLVLSVGCPILNLSCIHLGLYKQPKRGHYIVNNKTIGVFS